MHRIGLLGSNEVFLVNDWLRKSYLSSMVSLCLKIGEICTWNVNYTISILISGNLYIVQKVHHVKAMRIEAIIWFEARLSKSQCL
jgi:hypothetical protein